MSKPTTCGVHVHTWGTKYGLDNEFWIYLDKLFYGGYPAHASLTLTIPINAQGDELVKKYCHDAIHRKIIPYKMKTVKLANGATEDVYEIIFSWWPDPADAQDWLLGDDVEDDRLSELDGVDFAWSAAAEEMFAPERRWYTGIIGASQKRIGPISLEHARDLDTDQRIILAKEAENARLARILDSNEVLLDKLAEKKINKGKAKFRRSEILLIWNILNIEPKNIMNEFEFREVLALAKKQQEQIKEIFASNSNEIQAAQQRLMAQGRGQFKVEDYLSLGAPEEGSVYLPLKTFAGTEIGVKNGMDAEEMLKQMQALVTDNKGFSIQSKNCSETVGKILEAGVQQSHLKTYAAKRFMGALASPQIVYNAAVRIQEGIIANEKSTIWHSIANFQPIRNAMGMLLKIILNPKASIIKKIPAGLGLVIVWPLAMISAAVTWPFRVIAKEIVNAGGSWSKNKYGISVEQLEPTNNEEVALGQYLRSKIDEIDITDPIEAIKLFALDLRYDKNCIPVFSEKTRATLMALIKKDNSVSPDLEHFIRLTLKQDVLQQLQFTDLLVLVDGLQGLAVLKIKTIAADPETKRVLAERKRSMSFSSTSTTTSEKAEVPGSTKDNDYKP